MSPVPSASSTSDTGTGPLRLLWINPVHTTAEDVPISRYLAQAHGDRLRTDVLSFSGAGPRHLEYGAYGALVLPRIVQAVGWAAREGYDAACIGCYYDPGLRGAREIAEGMVVAAPGEASMALVRGIAHRFSILVVNEGCIPETREVVHRNDMTDRVAGYQTLALTVPELQADPGATYTAMLAAGRRALDEDGAEALLLGCTLEYGMARRLSSELGVPVLDAVDSAVAYAISLAEMRRSCGSASSGRAYTRLSGEEKLLYDLDAPPGPLTRAP